MATVAAGTHRIVVVEDHPIFRDGLIQCLDAEPDFTVVGQFATGTIAPAAVAHLAPDLVLMDIELPEHSGIDVTRALRAALPDLRVTLRTEYLHGRLTPQLTVILNPRGTYAVAPSLSYRWSDNLVIDLRYVTLMGGFFQKANRHNESVLLIEN